MPSCYEGGGLLRCCVSVNCDWVGGASAEQTKVPVEADPAVFKAELQASLDDLLLSGLGFIDLFAFHGINRHFQLVTHPPCPPSTMQL